MKTTRDDNQGIPAHCVNKPMFVIDTTGPESGEVPFESFRFADTLERRPQTIFDYGVEFPQQFSFVLLKPGVVFPTRRCERQIDSAANGCAVY